MHSKQGFWLFVPKIKISGAKEGGAKEGEGGGKKPLAPPSCANAYISGLSGYLVGATTRLKKDRKLMMWLHETIIGGHQTTNPRTLD